MKLITKIFFIVLACFVFGTTVLYFVADLLGWGSNILNAIGNWLDEIGWLQRTIKGWAK